MLLFIIYSQLSLRMQQRPWRRRRGVIVRRFHSSLIFTSLIFTLPPQRARGFLAGSNAMQCV